MHLQTKLGVLQGQCVQILEKLIEKDVTPAHFISKLTDSDAENSETQVWIDFAFACKYIDEKTSISFIQRSEEVGRLINHMTANPEKYL